MASRGWQSVTRHGMGTRRALLRPLGGSPLLTLFYPIWTARATAARSLHRDPDGNDLIHQTDMTSLQSLTRCILASFVLSISPIGAGAQPIELSQSQLRQLVAQQQIIGAEQLVGGVTNMFSGSVIDIRGFFADGRMTYRVLMQQSDGAVVEVLINGQNGRQVSHRSTHGQAIAAVARAVQTASQARAGNASQNSSSINRSGSNSNGNAKSNSRSSNDSGSSAGNARSSNSNSNSNSSNRDNDRSNRGNKEGRGNGNNN